MTVREQFRRMRGRYSHLYGNRPPLMESQLLVLEALRAGDFDLARYWLSYTLSLDQQWRRSLGKPSVTPPEVGE